MRGKDNKLFSAIVVFICAAAIAVLTVIAVMEGL